MQLVKLTTLTIPNNVINNLMYRVVAESDKKIDGYTFERGEAGITFEIEWDVSNFKKTAKYILTFVDNHYLVMQNDREYLSIFQYDITNKRYTIESRYKEDAFLCCSFMRWVLQV